MGAPTRVRRWRHTVIALGAVGAALGTLAACDDVEGGLRASTVAVTTDKVGTRALERGGVDVEWLTCTAQTRREADDGSATPRSRHEGRVRVSCRGKTKGGRDLEIGGTVTYVREDRCVRGALTGTLAGRVVFEAGLIGECGRGGSDSDPDGRSTKARSSRADPPPTARHRPTTPAGPAASARPTAPATGAGQGGASGGTGDGGAPGDSGTTDAGAASGSRGGDVGSSVA
ncbi:hypothetical protein [Streptomyces sp. NPDC057702]|uniref:hypothetical protein n=1 Tax=unclassified Streptomyces TaxID=2593676 RepID=UPI00367E0446